MLELYVLDSEFTPLGVVDGFASLIWTRKYYDTGSFELHAPAEAFTLLNAGRYVYCGAFRDTGVILTVEYKRGSGKKEVVAKGRFLDWVLEDRVFETVYTYGGTAEAVARDMVDAKAVQARPIAGLTLGAAHGLGERIDGQITGGVLRETIYRLLAEQELSARVLLDHQTNALIFEVWQGLDRTDAQTVNSWAIFSDDFENISSSEIKYDSSDSRNVAYVAGEGEGAERTVVEVDLSAGDTRREMYVDARDIRQTVDDVTMTDLVYAELLRQRGREKLAEHNRRLTISGELAASGSAVYGTDFDLGDKVTFIDHAAGISADDRITEIREIYEKNARAVEITVGKQAPTIRQLITKGVV